MFFTPGKWQALLVGVEIRVTLDRVFHSGFRAVAGQESGQGPLLRWASSNSGVPSKGSSPGSVRLHVNWWAIPVEFPFQVTIWSIEPSELPDGEMVHEPSMGKEQWLNYCDLWGSRSKGNSSAVCLLSVESFVCETDERNSVE